MSSRLRVLVYVVFIGILITLAEQSALYGQTREKYPAVVNSIFVSPLQNIISLDGTWQFALDSQDKGQQQQWFHPESRPLPLRLLQCQQQQLCLQQSSYWSPLPYLLL